MARFLIGVGICLVLAGIMWPWLQKAGLFHLPGDISVKSGKYSFHFPIVTCLILSLGLSLILWLIRSLK